VGDRLTPYEDALASLFARTTGEWRLGLERTRALLAAIGDPHHALRVIHVAGTNGKGSVCATVDTVLRARGVRVARYTSPHLVDFRERFLIDGQMVPSATMAALVEQCLPTVEAVGATFFEATTAMGFKLFADAGVDVAVVEVGLGGRLDATNVVDPMLAVVTSIGLDHTEFLGDTLALIAAEKAGIYKPGRPAVVGDRDPEIAALLRAHAERAGATPVATTAGWARLATVAVTGAGTHFTLDGVPYHTPLVGTHQAANTAVALHALECLPAPFYTPRAEAAAALARVTLPGRMERVGRYVFDVAHNPAGAAVCALATRALDLPRPLTLVLGVLADKDWRGMLTALAPVADRIILTTPPTAPANRRWEVDAVLAEATAAGVTAEAIPDLSAALAEAERSPGTILVTGSFHTVGDAMRALNISPFPE
jgi:dihydrofolate synthase/folylpolyglutamate synthase